MTSPEIESKTPFAATIRSRFEQVIERSHGILRRAAASRRLDPAEVDELVQELRVRLWRAAGDDPSPERLSPAYVHRAAMTAAIDVIRRRQSVRFSALDDNAAPFEARERSDAGIDRDDLSRVLEDTLAAMMASRATVVRMHLAGYDRLEIASLLGWSEAKTRNLLYRGLHDVREGLAQRGFTP